MDQELLVTRKMYVQSSQKRRAVSHSITLAIPDLKDELQSYEVVIDGSQNGMGAHLSQKINGERRIKQLTRYDVMLKTLPSIT